MDSEGEEEVLMCVGEAGHPRVYLMIFLTRERWTVTMRRNCLMCCYSRVFLMIFLTWERWTVRVRRKC